MADVDTVSVSILDRDYQVNCPPGEEEALRSSARFLDQQMRQKLFLRHPVRRRDTRRKLATEATLLWLPL